MTSIMTDTTADTKHTAPIAATSWILSHPEIHAHSIDLMGDRPRIYIYGLDLDDIRTHIRHLGGRWDKDPGATIYSLRQPHPAGFDVEFTVMRDQVCERVVVGTETVEREIVEWRCEDGSVLGRAA